MIVTVKQLNKEFEVSDSVNSTSVHAVHCSKIPTIPLVKDAEYITIEVDGKISVDLSKLPEVSELLGKAYSLGFKAGVEFELDID